MMSKTELAQEIYRISNLKGEFKLRSGRAAKEYFDKYLFESDPVILKQIALHLARLIPNEFDFLAGLEMGGIPIATALSLELDKPILFVRKKAKTYGTCKLAEGGDIQSASLIIIEDVITSGGAVMDAVTALRNLGANVERVYCVIDREEDGGKNLEAMGLQMFSLFTRSELENA